MVLKYELKHKDRSMLRITTELYDSIKDLAKQLDVTIVDATRRVIGVGFKIILQYEHGIRPYARKTQNPYDKKKKYKFIKVTRYIHMAIRLYALWLNITITDNTPPASIIPISGEAPENNSWVTTSSAY